MQPLAVQSPVRLNQSRFYHEDVMKLTASLILHSHSTAVAMNDAVEEYYQSRGIFYQVDKDNPQSWRYYCHLQGIYHQYDIDTINVLKVRSLDNLQIIEFTKENLKYHRATLSHYYHRGEFYQELVNKYPDYHILIDGITRDLTFEQCWKTPDYEIIDYNKKYVEEQEFYLIPSLNKMIKEARNSYRSRNYYVHRKGWEGMFLGVLATQIPGMIIALREQYVNTPYAHSFHIWNYLASHCELDRFKQYLTFEQVMWLYRHIRYIQSRSGQAYSFEKLIEVMMTWRGFPVYGFDVDTLDEKSTVTRDQLNLLGHVFKHDDDGLNIDRLFDKEDGLAERNHLFKEKHLKVAEDKLDKNPISNRKSKLIESTVFNYNHEEVIPLKGIALNYWIYLSNTGKYDYLGQLTNPKTAEIFAATPKEGFILWLYLTMKLANKLHRKSVDKMIIPDFTAYDILVPEMNHNYMKTVLCNQKIHIRHAIELLLMNLPTHHTLYSPEQFAEYVKEVREFRLDNRYIRAHCGDLAQHSEIQHMDQHLLFHKNFVLYDNISTEPLSFIQFFESKHWEVMDLDEEQMLSLAVNTYAHFTGGMLLESSDLSDVQRAMLAILKELSSYTVQFTAEVYGSNNRILDMPFPKWGHIHAMETAITNLFTKWLPRWQNITAQQFGHVIYAPTMVSKEFKPVAHEIDTVDALKVPTWHLTGLTETRREVSFPLLAWKTKRTGVDYTPNRKRRDNFYIYNGTIFHWQSDNPDFRKYFRGKRGLIPNGDRL